MYRRVAVEEGVWGKGFFPLDLLDGSSSRFPHGATPYFFGYELYKELWARKGAKGIYHLTDSYSRNLPFLHDPSLREAYGADFDEVWRGIYRKTTEQERHEIERIKRNPLSDLRYLTQTKFGKWDLALSPSANGWRTAATIRKREAGSKLSTSIAAL